MTLADLEKSLREGCRAWVAAGSVPASELERLRGLAVIVGRRSGQSGREVLTEALRRVQAVESNAG